MNLLQIQLIHHQQHNRLTNYIKQTQPHNKVSFLLSITSVSKIEPSFFVQTTSPALDQSTEILANPLSPGDAELTYGKPATNKPFVDDTLMYTDFQDIARFHAPE